MTNRSIEGHQNVPCAIFLIYSLLFNSGRAKKQVETFLKMWFLRALGSGGCTAVLLSLSDGSVGILFVQGSFVPSFFWTLLGLDLFLPADHERWSATYTVTSTRAIFMFGNVPHGTLIVTVTCHGWRGPDRVGSNVRNLTANSNFAQIQGL